MVVSSAVTFTLKTVSPTTSATWWPSSTESASASAASDASRYTYVELAWLFAGVTVTSSTLLATDAV